MRKTINYDCLSTIKYKIGLSTIIILGLTLISSCKKFIAIDGPNSEIITKSVYAKDATAIAAVTGIYGRMISTLGFASGGLYGITFQTGLSADELIDHSNSPFQQEFSKNGLLASNSNNELYLWGEAYEYIYSANSAIEGLANSTGVSQPVKKQLEGEAKFIRAFCHFYLVNLYGDIPLITSTDYRTNAKITRTSKEQVFQQIINDLINSESLLNNDYPSPERVRPNKWVARALLSRVYLYISDWIKAKSHASSLIENVSLFSLEDNLINVFLKNSKEAIWQLMPTSPSYNTNEGRYFILTSTPTNVSLSEELYLSFENNDKRKADWIGVIQIGSNTYYFPHKYKIRMGGNPSNEYSMILRIAEQYLIRAEASAQMNDLEGAIADLDKIRHRAGLPLLSVVNPNINKNDLLLFIEKERRAELFTEWGHRWLDLKRTGRAGAVLAPFKTGWQSTDALYPIPQKEIEKNYNLAPQNLGY